MRSSTTIGRPSVLLKGWFGYGNSGDDALLKCIDTCLTSSSASPPVTLRTPNWGLLPPLDHPFSIKPIRRRFKGEPLMADFLSLVASSSALVWGGGSSISDTSPNWRIALQEKYWMSKVASKLKIPVLFNALGVGPITTARGRKMVTEIIGSAHTVVTRDHESLNFCKAVSPSSNIDFGFDPAILLAKPTTSRRGGLVRVGVSIAASEGSLLESSLAKRERRIALSRALLSAAEGLDVEFSPIQMCAHPTRDDLPEAEAVLQDFPSNQIGPPVYYSSDPSVMASRIAELDLVIAERFHASVFAYGSDVPFAPIPYHQKCVDLADLVELPSIARLKSCPTEESIRVLLEKTMTDPAALKPRMPLEHAIGSAQRGLETFRTQLNSAVCGD